MRHGIKQRLKRLELLWDGLILGLLIGVFCGVWMQKAGWITGLTGWMIPCSIMFLGVIPRTIVQLVRGIQTFRAARDHQPDGAE
jgi:Na+/H+-dicarboxylate symporter